MRQPKDNLAYLQHILEAVQQLIEYRSTHSYEEFMDNDWDQAAAIRHLEIIGEAANQVEKSFQASYPGIPWKTIIGLRNVLIHGYMDVDIDIVWKIIESDLDSLLVEITRLLKL